MRLAIVARGRIGASPEADLVDRYAKRMRGELTVTEIGDTAPWPRWDGGRTVVVTNNGAIAGHIDPRRFAKLPLYHVAEARTV